MNRVSGNEIRLTGEQAKKFNKMAKNPDPTICVRKQAYLNHINETTKIKREGSKVIVSVDTSKKF